MTRPNLERAIEYFHQATRIDPRMAVAYGGLADCYDVLPITSDVRPGEAFPKSEHAATQALKIDQGLAEAHSALASVRFWYHWDWGASEEHSRRAIERNSNHAWAHLRYGHMLSNTRRHEQAVAEIEAARQLDPFSPIINTLCAQFRFQARRYDEALIAAQKAFQFSGGNTEASALMGYTHGLMGRRAEAEKALEELQRSGAQKFVPPYNVATVHLGLGDSEKTLDWLEKAYQERDVHMVFLNVEPKWDTVHSLPGFQSLLRRVALS